MTDIQKGNFIKPIFLLAFVKWISSRHPWIYCHKIVVKNDYVQVKMVDESLNKLTNDLNTSQYYHMTTYMGFLPMERRYHDPIRAMIDNLFELGIIFVVLSSRENDNKSDISFTLDKSKGYYRLNNMYYISQLDDYLIQLTGERLLSEYDPTSEYYFNESLFNELFSLIRQSFLSQFREMVLQYT